MSVDFLFDRMMGSNSRSSDSSTEAFGLSFNLSDIFSQFLRKGSNIWSDTSVVTVNGKGLTKGAFGGTFYKQFEQQKEKTDL